MIFKNIISAVVTIFCSSSLFSQSLTGRVIEWDEGMSMEMPLPGASVYWKNTNSGANTDANGNFQIPAPAALPAALIVSFVGYRNDTIHVTELSFRKIVLRKSVDLKEVEVSVHENATKISTINPINTEHVTEKELLKAACCNLSESFETNPTVNVAYKDAVTGAKEIQLLGLSGIYSQLLAENIPAMRGIAGIYGLTFIPGPWMDGIQVTKGSGSVLNGYESTTGQINVEFKKPDNKKLPGFYLNLFGEGNGNTELNSYFRRELNKKWSTILMLHGNYMNTAMDKNDDGFYDVPLSKQLNIYSRWQYHSGSKTESQIGFKYLYDEKQGGQIHPDPAYSGLQYKTMIVNQRAEVFGKLGFVYPESPAKSIGNIFQATVHELHAAIGSNYYNAAEKELYYEGICQDNIGNANHQYRTGVSFMYDHLDDDFNQAHSIHEQFVPGAFAEYTFSRLEKFKLILGAREDYHKEDGWIFIPRLHGKYNFTDNFIVRYSAGKSYRVPYPLADNISILASSRAVRFNEAIKAEEAWNYGVNFTKRWEIGHREGSLSIDLYRTVFINQLVVDEYSDSSTVQFYNLQGSSYSNSFQVTFNQDLLDNLGLRLAYKLDDVKITYMGTLSQKPLVSRERALANLFFSTANQHWKFDYTLVWEGKKKLAGTVTDVEFGKMPASSPDFFIMHFQVTKQFKRFEVYGGAENLLDYRQLHPVINAQNPFGNSFDATRIWGPIEGRRIYAGLRLSIR